MLGKTLRGRYKIIRELGFGGFGQTYLAEDQDIPSHPNCVVKQLKRQHINNPQVVVRFEQEAQVLYKLGNHDQIPRLLAHFTENQEFYLVQEFIDGHDLSQELTLGKQWTEQQVIEFLLDVLNILDFVHQQGIIHRDIKPANIIRRYADGKSVLIDFGAVKEFSTLAANIPGNTVTIGTYGYMPGEQANGNPRLSSDIYAVGIICIQALTGINPAAQGGNGLPKDKFQEEIIWRDAYGGKLRVNVSPKLADILDKMVRYHFRDRYQSAAEVLQALISLKKVYVPSRNQKIALAIIGSIVIIFSLTILVIPQIQYIISSPSENSASTAFKNYEDSTSGIKIKYPADWRKNDITDIFTGDLVEFLAPAKNGNENFPPKLNIEVTELKTPISLPEYTQNKITEITRYLKNAKIHKSEPTIMANLPPVHTVVYSGKEKQMDVKRMAIWLLKNDRAYMITYTAEESQYDEFLTTAQEMINSVEIR